MQLLIRGRDDNTTHSWCWWAYGVRSVHFALLCFCVRRFWLAVVDGGRRGGERTRKCQNWGLFHVEGRNIALRLLQLLTYSLLEYLVSKPLLYLFTVKNHTFTLLLPQIALTHVSFLHLVGCLALLVPDTAISLRTHNHGLIINIRHLIRNHLHLIFTEEDT